MTAVPRQHPGDALSLLALLNPSRAFLAMSAVLAGYCLIRFYAYTAGNILVVPYLLAAGAFLGMAESAWKNLFETAAGNNPRSGDLQSGTISTTAGFFIAVFTTIGGLMCAMTGGFNAFRAAGLLVLVSLFRCALFRHTEVLTPLLKGASFGLLFIIGMTAHPSFAEMLYIGETRIPAAFFTFYMIVTAVLAQVRDSARPRATPAGEQLVNETASRLLEIRDSAIDPTVVWFAGGTLVLIPLILAWIMPWKWLSVIILAFLAVITLVRLIPVLVYRTRRDLVAFIESAYRGGALLSAGAVASLGDYRLREFYHGWSIPMPPRDELAAIFVIAVLAVPAWLLRKGAPID